MWHSSRHSKSGRLQVNMFIVGLLIVSVGAEWVEIAQNNYRLESPRLKPTDNVKYPNQTLSPWKRGSINKISHIGNIRRVPYASVKTPSVTLHDVDSPSSQGQGTVSLPNTRIQGNNNNRNVHKLELDDSNSDIYVTRGEDSRVKNLTSSHGTNVNKESEGLQGASEGNEILSSRIKQADKNSNVHSSKNNEKVFYKDKFVSDDDVVSPVSGENMERIWNTVKLVANTITKQSRRGLKSKVRYLEDLKDTMLCSVEGYIDVLWPDDEDLGRSRRSTESRGHVEVPSSEGALMTISFLTFAVFLIKLVLQVIHTYKQKAMMVTPTIVAAVGRAGGTFVKNLH